MGEARLGVSNLRNAGLSGPLSVGSPQMCLVMTPNGPAVKAWFGTVLLSEAIEAAYLLRQIISTLDLEAIQGDAYEFTFSCGVEVHDGLCEFGAETESDEDDGCAEYDSRNLQRTLPERPELTALAA